MAYHLAMEAGAHSHYGNISMVIDMISPAAPVTDISLQVK